MVAPAEASLTGRYPVDRVEAAPVYNDIYEAFNCTRNRKQVGPSLLKR